MVRKGLLGTLPYSNTGTVKESYRQFSNAVRRSSFPTISTITIYFGSSVLVKNRPRKNNKDNAV